MAVICPVPAKPVTTSATLVATVGRSTGSLVRVMDWTPLTPVTEAADCVAASDPASVAFVETVRPVTLVRSER
jgi:hypothetical protein